jgi:hypothetical protein
MEATPSVIDAPVLESTHEAKLTEALAAEGVSKPRGQKRWLLTIGKGTVSGGLIFWLLYDTNLQDIFHALQLAKLPILCLAFSLHFLGCYVSVLRWSVLLRAQNLVLPISTLLKSYMVALFFNNLLPSTVGGDVVRVYDTCRLGKDKAGAVTTVFVDRLLGIFVLMGFLSGSLLLLKRFPTPLSHSYRWVLSSGGILLAIAWAVLRAYRHMTTTATMVPLPSVNRIQQLIKKTIESLLRLKQRKDLLAVALILSLILQINVVMYYYLIALGIGISVPFKDFFLIVPLAIFVMMIPVSINGVGLRENVFVLFFATFGVMKAEAIAFAWLDYGMVLMLGIIGGVVYAFLR